LRHSIALKTTLGLRWLVLTLLVCSYPIATLLPTSAGWENGWIEDLQLAVLVAGLGCALWSRRPGAVARPTQDISRPRLATIAVPVWLLCTARETSWGATLLTPGMPTGEGRYYTSSVLWYHPMIAPVVLVVLAGAVVAFVRWRLDRPLLQLVRDHRFPWPELALMGLAAALSTLAEGKLPITVPGSEQMRMVMEEGTELLCYAALFLVQARLFTEMAEMAVPARPISPPRA
jgi:hypothetical protein